MQKKLLHLVIVSLLIAFTLSACTPAANVTPAAAPEADVRAELAQEAEPEAEQESEQESEAAPEAVDPAPPDCIHTLVVTDHAGRMVTIDRVVERIISGFYISTSAIIALGLEDKLVGIEARADMRPIYALAAPHLLELPNVGTAREFNMEAALALRPDLVILPMRQQDAAEILEELGILVLLVEPENPDKLINMINMIGSVAGGWRNADALDQFYRQSLREIEEMTADIAERPTVYMAGVGSYLSTSPGGMYQSSLIEMAGGINIAGDIEGVSRIDVSYEQLLAWDPDVIIIPPEADFRPEDILTNPQLAQLTAVQNGRVYHMPGYFEAWDSPVPSFTLGIRWLMSALHPDIYSMDVMWEYAADFYAEFYGFDIDLELIKR